MTDVLVAYASRHGSTEELAREIGGQLTHAGLSVEVLPMDEVESLDRYSAFVLGSAVYIGSWMPAARAFIDHHRESLAAKPTWLFSSGPIGDPQFAGANAFDPRDLVEAAHARDHHLFGGKLDRGELNVGERLLARIVGSVDGDYRDWALVDAWALTISRALTPSRWA